MSYSTLSGFGLGSSRDWSVFLNAHFSNNNALVVAFYLVNVAPTHVLVFPWIELAFSRVFLRSKTFVVRFTGVDWDVPLYS